MKLTFVIILASSIFNQIKCSYFPSTLSHIRPRVTLETQATAVQELIKRIIPTKAYLFDVTVTSVNDETKDTFTVFKREQNNTIVITGNTGVVVAAGFHYYLKTFCNCHISWETSQLNLPEELPNVNITIPLNDRFRYYQNVCTTSYSFVWWDWKQWEKHIDWMALNAFNLVLAFNGQEAIWERVYKKFNLTSTDIDEHFTGPAFLSWLRMGNMRGWGGPLSPAWHSRSLILQKQIVSRMRDLGMVPVLPAFAGHLPRAFKRIYPDAKMVKMNSWNNFNDTYCCPYFLDPTEELFNEIGKAFLSEQISEFGTDHIYNCDSFNENTPASGDVTYLTNVGNSIYKAMTDSDPNAIWLMQNWMFVNEDFFWTTDRAKAILTSVPKGKMIILDLQSEQWPLYQIFDQYFGQPYIWCMLHDFGGTLGMFGSSSIVNEKALEARRMQNSTMVGTGLTPEGINQNYAIYDLMIDNAWKETPANLTQWFENYAIRRYGFADENANEAWRILQRTIYDFNGLERIRGKYAIARSPRLTISVWRWYSPSDLMQAWTNLLAASENLSDNSGYLHDLVDITRQALQVIGDLYYQQTVKAYAKKDKRAFGTSAQTFLEVFVDLESILATNKAFLLGPWIESAKAAANSSKDRQQHEYNARNQITLWGPRGEIMDYATKQWSGVVSNFFSPRWQMFVGYLNETLMNNETFNQTFIKDKVFNELEKPFTYDLSEFPVEPTGDTVKIAKAIHKKWLSGGNLKRKFRGQRKHSGHYT